jgi:hypothetical protein
MTRIRAEQEAAMRTLPIDSELHVLCPDGFHELTDGERSRLVMPWSGPWVGISDPERHVLVTAGSRKAGLFAGLLLSARDLARNMEKRIRGAMTPFGFRAGGAAERVIAGERAFGFRYAYEAQGIAMCAESCVFKRRGKIFFLHLYARDERREESFAVWEKILSSVRPG